MIQTFLFPLEYKNPFLNNELWIRKIFERFRANKVSLNATKANYTLFHKNSHKDTLPFKMLELKIGNSIIKRKSSVKSLSVMLDGNILWKDHIKTLKKSSQKDLFVISHKTMSWWDVLKNHTFFIYSLTFKLYKHSLGKYLDNKVKAIIL